MSFLRFAFDEVKEMVTTLESSGGRMKGASKEMLRADTAHFGHGGLQSAGDEFADSWNYGFGQLSKMTKDISKFADKCANEFDGLDKKLRDELVKGTRG
ncbi:hypothetical protein [Streptomyces synnematoformans]|uniref:WXG100 family type VII secretion target n=1 Tax=Streptomyces synnematoformans TaxID=415721 RepID=A0ABN2YDQ4_9ACTN